MDRLPFDFILNYAIQVEYSDVTIKLDGILSFVLCIL